MSDIKFNSQICANLKQSKRLLELGLKPETADMYIFDDEVYIGKPNVDDIPAWSLHRLIEMSPTVITHDDYSLILGINATCVYYADDEYAETFKAFEGNLYDCVVKCIEWLIKEGYFNKEYLKQ